MIRAYDEYGNIICLVEWEKKIRSNAIDDFVYAVKRRFPNDKNGIFHIEKIAEQLKAGAKND